MLSTERRYQIFVSSTFEDLREERQQVTQAILELGGFPSGMELFPASDQSAWRLIQSVIQECDYYLVVVGGKYGSIGPDGLSYTEMEFDYAVEIGVPIMGFVQKLSDDTAVKKVETDARKRRALDSFREKVKARACVMFSDPNELGMAVMKSLVAESRVNPRTGWVRADKARSDEDRDREIDLRTKLAEAEEEITQLERRLRDARVLTEELQPADLAQGSEKFLFEVRFRDAKKKMLVRNIDLTWDEIFLTIGSQMYGYIVRKSDRYGDKGKYAFEASLEEILRRKALEEVGERAIYIRPDQIDSCMIQFKELGLVEYREKENEDGSTFRGYVLTDAGEKHLSRLTVRLNSNSSV